MTQRRIVLVALIVPLLLGLAGPPSGDGDARRAASGAAAAPAADAATACADLPIAPFVDVPRRSPHAASIDCLTWYEVAAGTSPDTFGPAAPVRRDQLATFVARSVGASQEPLPPRPAPANYPDLGAGVHRPAIDALTAAGVIAARDDGRFWPREPATRAEAAAQLARAYDYVTGAAPSGAPDAFADDDGHPLEADIDVAAALGLVRGKTAEVFAPEERLRRDQMASLLARLVDRWAAQGWLEPRPAAYRATVEPLGDRLRQRMNGVSWRPGCPVPLEQLRLLSLVHHDVDGNQRIGLLVVHADVADTVGAAFADLYAAKFPVARMQPVSRFGGDDARSMAANNSSAFNCRAVTGGTTWSEHSYGRAIDLNPHQNPYVRGATVLPAAGRAYLDRSHVRPGMLVRPGAAVAAFDAVGWGWGGDWRGVRDYQHVSATGR